MSLETINPKLLRGLSVYQDIVLAGQTVLRGQRDCQARWEAMEPHLPAAATILDVGANFGWFGWNICRTRPECVVASVEADPRSAAVQRQVLASNELRRVCLLTDRAGVRMARRFTAAGQRFDAVLCLSVLHWIADHRSFLTALAPITGRFLIEQPDPREAGAGVARLRSEIGPMDRYLAEVFPDRPITCVATWPSHRESPYPRNLWLVGEPAGWPVAPSPGLDAEALLDLHPGWPERSWWRSQLKTSTDPQPGRWILSPGGLQRIEGAGHDAGAARLRRKANGVPESHAFGWKRAWWLRMRRWAGALLRACRPRPAGH